MKWTSITLANIDSLDALLRDNNSPDPYACSPSYFALTGRHGLWLVEEGRAAAVVCRHPNVRRQLLAFPPFGEGACALLRRLLSEYPDLRLARTPASFDAASAGLQTVEEELLDWRYPVHTLDNYRVAAMTGGKFGKIRQRTRQLMRSGVTVRPLELGDKEPILRFAREWTQTQHQGLSASELYAPYERAFDLLACPDLALNAVSFCAGDELVGMYIWERPQWRAHMATGLISLTSRRIRGLAEFQHVVMCKLLSEMGAPYLCIGGAETAGLDAFKRKFDPVASLPLSTMKARAAQERLAEDIAA